MNTNNNPRDIRTLDRNEIQVLSTDLNYYIVTELLPGPKETINMIKSKISYPDSFDSKPLNYLINIDTLCKNIHKAYPQGKIIVTLQLDIFDYSHLLDIEIVTPVSRYFLSYDAMVDISNNVDIKPPPKTIPDQVSIKTAIKLNTHFQTQLLSGNISKKPIPLVYGLMFYPLLPTQTNYGERLQFFKLRKPIMQYTKQN
jgi:hypothetical protein